MTSPPPPGGGGRTYAGLPLWGWGVIAAAAIAAGVYLRLRRSRSGTSTTQDVSTSAQPADQQIGLTEYEQISSQLTGIEGTNQALLAAIKDLQGDEGEPPKRRDRDGDSDDTDKDRGKVTVPSVTGRSYQEAAAQLASHDLRAHRGNAAQPPAVVERQTPDAGDKAPRDSAVTLSMRHVQPRK